MTAENYPPLPEPNALQRALTSFLADYELRGEDEDGRDGCYTPNATERYLIEDFVWGLMEDDDWKAALASRPAPATVGEIGDAQQVLLSQLVELARIVSRGVEDWGESFQDGSMDVKFHKEEAEKLSAILDAFDELPDPDDGVYIYGPVGKAEHVILALRPAAADVPAVAGDGTLCSACEGSGTVIEVTGHLGPDDYECEAECWACHGTGSSDIRDAINALSYQPHSVTPARQMVYRGDVLRIIEARVALTPSATPPAKAPAQEHEAARHVMDGVGSEQDWRLPFDVTIGAGTWRKGIKFSSLMLYVKSLYQRLHGVDPDEVAKRTPEQHSKLMERLLNPDPRPAHEQMLDVIKAETPGADVLNLVVAAPAEAGSGQGGEPVASFLADKLDEMTRRKDAAYLERNQVVAALAHAYPSGIARTAIEGWSEDWHGCVYIDLPTGQASWHYHDSHAGLFAHLPPYTSSWDGHTTEQKYERLAALAAPASQAVTASGDGEALISWVCERWHAEVANRPLVNVHRRSLDDTWRQVLRHLGVDDEARLGPRHDDLLAARQQKGEA